MHLAREIVFARRRRAAVEADPHAQQRIGEAVALLPCRDEIDVLQPREIVFRRPGGSLQPVRDLGERQPFVFAEDFENRLQRPVAARAMQPQLVAEEALLRDAAVDGEERRERAHRVGAARAAVLAQRLQLVGDRADVRRTPVGEREHRSRQILRVLGVAAGRAEDVKRVLDRQRRHLDDFEARRVVAQQPQRTRDVAARQHEPVAAGGDALDEVVQDAPQSGKALERAQLQELVEQEHRRLAGAGPAVREEVERHVERGARARRGRVGDREGRPVDRRTVEALRRRRRALDVDALRRHPAGPLAQLLQQRASSAAAPAEENRDAGWRRVERRGDAPGQRSTRGQHSPSSRNGIRKPCRSAVAIASG